MKSVWIYKKGELAYSSRDVNPLVYNAVRGFADIGDRYYSEKLKYIRMGPYTVSVMEGAGEVLIFAIDERERNLDEVYRIYLDAEKNDDRGCRDVSGLTTSF